MQRGRFGVMSQLVVKEPGKVALKTRSSIRAALLDPADARAVLLLAILIILATLGSLYIVGWAHDFVLCDMECGETLLAIKAADQFATLGVRYALLEVLGPDDNPVVYTHSVNLGTLTFVGLQ